MIQEQLEEAYIIIEFNDECKGFLVGSDQLWKPFLSRPFKQFFFLDFVFNEQRFIYFLKLK